MIHFKERKIPVDLKVLEILNKRMLLSSEDKQSYSSLQRGYTGEKEFDRLLKGHELNAYLLNDLLLEMNGTYFQIDSLLITRDKVYVYEVKNYAGEFSYEDDQLYKLPKNEVINPLHQLGRMLPLLTQLLRKHGFNLPIQGHIVFINPNFTLFRAPMNTPMILPTQINPHLRSLSKTSGQLTQTHKKLADQLLELHISGSPFKHEFDYSFEELHKGICCMTCEKYYPQFKRKFFSCVYCSSKESADKAILRMVDELKLLFPNKKITSRLVYEWCGKLVSIKTITRVLNNNLTSRSNNRGRYYEKGC